MNEQENPVLRVEKIHEDDSEHSHVLIALSGLNRRIVNHESTTSYLVLSGSGKMHVGDQEVELKPGTIVNVPAGTPYHDEGEVKMEAISTPPFNPESIEEL